MPWDGLACLRNADLAPADGCGPGFEGRWDGVAGAFVDAALDARDARGPLGGAGVGVGVEDCLRSAEESVFWFKEATVGFAVVVVPEAPVVLDADALGVR